jgi:hypothetical protein
MSKKEKLEVEDSAKEYKEGLKKMNKKEIKKEKDSKPVKAGKRSEEAEEGNPIKDKIAQISVDAKELSKDKKKAKNIDNDKKRKAALDKISLKANHLENERAHLQNKLIDGKKSDSSSSYKPKKV